MVGAFIPESVGIATVSEGVVEAGVPEGVGVADACTTIVSKHNYV